MTSATTTSWDHNVGPLTTTATLPASCFEGHHDRLTNVYLGQNCISLESDLYAVQDDPSCWPSPANDSPDEDAAKQHMTPPMYGFGYYSPGIFCPSGYATACRAGAESASATDVAFFFQFPIAASETAYGCCPEGYMCNLQDGLQTCISVASSTVLLQRACTYGTTGPLGPLSVPFTSTYVSDSTQYTSTVSSVTAYAPLIQLVRQTSDESLVPSSTSTSPASESTASTSSKNSLSGGAIAGIVVGVVVAGLLAGAAFWVYRKRYKKRRHNNEIVPEPAQVFMTPPGEPVEMLVSESPRVASHGMAQEIAAPSPHSRGLHEQHILQQHPGYQAVELQ